MARGFGRSNSQRYRVAKSFPRNAWNVSAKAEQRNPPQRELDRSEAAISASFDIDTTIGKALSSDR